MKKILSFAFILLVAIFSAFTNISAQTKELPEQSALMYEITGNGLKKPSYLFGTMHIICPADMIAMVKFNKYIIETERIIMEIDMDDQAEIQDAAKLAYLPEGKVLADIFTAEKFAKVGELVKDSLGFPIENVKNIHPMFLGVLIGSSPKFIGCNTPGSYERSFLQTAAANKKPIEGLETIAMQIETLNSSPLEKQTEGLYKMALDPQKSADEFKKLVEAYKSQDSDVLYEILQSALADDPAFEVNLLPKRNIAWIPKIEKAINEKSSFIAVGAGHLGGQNGVVKLLRARGYSIKPIRLSH